MSKNMIHLNGNILCAIDVETTGDVPGFHDMWQICILPVNEKWEARTDIVPFYCDLIIKRPENIILEAMKNKQRFIDSQKNGLDPWVAVDLFDEWFQKLGIGLRKRICPLAQNWVFDRGFIQDWLGYEAFDQQFDARYRDTQAVALYLNDVADSEVEQYPFPKVNLSYLCSQLKVDHTGAHDALADCVATIEVYKKFVLKKY